MKFVAVIPNDVADMETVNTEPMPLYPVEVLGDNSIVVIETDDYEYNPVTGAYYTEMLHKKDIEHKYVLK